MKPNEEDRRTLKMTDQLTDENEPMNWRWRRTTNDGQNNNEKPDEVDEGPMTIVDNGEK